MMKNFLFVVCCLSFVVGFAQTKKTFYIADRLVTCDKKDCLQIKEKKKGEWQTITDTINGLHYEEGFEYKVKVVEGTGLIKYTLLKLSSKKKTGYNPAIRLENKKWVLKTMFDSISFMSLGDTIVYINIDVAHNRLSGHGVCNKLKGELKAEGKNISFSNLSYTKMKCVDQGNIMEKIVTNLLEVTNTYQLKGSQLILYSSKGSYLVFEGR